MSIGRFAGRSVELGPARRADWPASGEYASAALGIWTYSAHNCVA